MKEFNIESNNENVIEFLTNNDRMGCTFTQKRWITKMKKLQANDPENITLIENKDGSIYCTLPVKYLKISPPKQVSEERRKELSIQMKRIQEQKK